MVNYKELVTDANDVQNSSAKSELGTGLWKAK